MAINTYYASTRIVGMHSGMDTESMITAMMQAESAKVNKYYRNVTTLEWKQSALQDVGTDLKAFRDTFFKTTGPSAMLNSSTYKAFNVVTNDTRNVATITANSEAFAQSITLKIDQLAKGASITSNRQVSKDGEGLAANNYETLGELKWATGHEPQWDSDGNVSIEINGVEFEFNRNDTLQSMINKINADEDADVTITYSRLTDGFTITSNKMGDESELKLKDLSGNFFDSLGINPNDASQFTAGQQAIVRINGTEVKRDSNNFSIDGIQYQLHKTTENLDSSGVPDGTHTLIEATVVQDIESSVEKITNFIDTYNALVNKLNGLLTEKKDSKYYALTSEEKKAMSDKEVEEWEALAKSGILRSDRDIQSLLDQLRSSFFNKIEEAGLSASQIGLSTGNYFTGNPGEIEVDEEKLRAALTKDPDALISVFMHDARNEDGTLDVANSGFLYQMQDSINTYVRTTQANTLDNIDRQLTSLNDRIETMEKKLYELQERYYLKFAAMETALSTMNSQLDYLTQMMAGMYS